MGDFLQLPDFSKLYSIYKTADILFIDDDPRIRTLFIKKIKKIKIKRDINDEGRNIIYNTFSKSTEILKDIIDNKSTYGLIIIDENLGPDSLTGSQCIKRIKNSGYKGTIISVINSYNPTDIVYKQSKSDGFITKSKMFFYDLNQLLNQLTTRDFKPNNNRRRIIVNA